MAPRRDAKPAEDGPRGAAGTSAEVAVKCDLCSEWDAPACVQACPTSALWRLDPQRDFSEVRGLLGASAPADDARHQSEPRWRRLALPLASALGLAGCVLGVGAHARGVWFSGQGVPWIAGLVAGVAVVGLGAHALPKRLVRRWMRRRPKESAARRLAGGDVAERAPRSRLAPYYLAHLGLGALTLGGVAAHAGARVPFGVAGALSLAFWSCALVGVVGALAQRLVPARLSRLERKGALPEDLSHERELALDRLHRATSGTSELVKTLADKILVPYARAPHGALALVLAGRSLAEEERVLRARIERLLEGRGGERLDGLPELVRIVVELRALPARRVLGAFLRGFLPLHIVLSGLLLALLLLHVVQMTRW